MRVFDDMVSDTFLQICNRVTPTVNAAVASLMCQFRGLYKVKPWYERKSESDTRRLNERVSSRSSGGLGPKASNRRLVTCSISVKVTTARNCVALAQNG